MSDTYVPLAQRGWSDLEPVPQNDVPNALVPIMYTEEYRDAMDYFRAAKAKGEKSERVLELTEAIIRLNPAHYTVWQYRFATLLELQRDLEAELELMNEFARENLKSYQVWHHRLLLLTHISPADPSSEIAFIHRSLSPDPKNYHTWAYLHWLYSHFGDLGRITPAMWADELQWCEGMIADDGRNNSAWGWRWFLRMARPDADGNKREGHDEVAYAVREIHRIPHNASAWNYLRGLVRAFGTRGGVGGAGLREELVPVLAPYMTGAAVELPADNADATASWPARTAPLAEDTPVPVPLALEFLGDALLESGKLGDAASVFAQLGDEVDKMHAAYWGLRKAECVNA